MLMISIVYFTVAVKYVRQPLSQDCTLDAKDVYLTFLSNVVSHLWEHICIQWSTSQHIVPCAIALNVILTKSVYWTLLQEIVSDGVIRICKNHRSLACLVLNVVNLND